VRGGRVWRRTVSKRSERPTEGLYKRGGKGITKHAGQQVRRGRVKDKVIKNRRERSGARSPPRTRRRNLNAW